MRILFITPTWTTIIYNNPVDIVSNTIQIQVLSPVVVLCATLEVPCLDTNKKKKCIIHIVSSLYLSAYSQWT
jgi:hypothetical protein